MHGSPIRALPAQCRIVNESKGDTIMSVPKAAKNRKPAPLQPPLVWDEINEPGAYVELQTGKLYRIPPETLHSSSLPLVEQGNALSSKLMQVNRKPLADSQFVQVSKNPFIFSLGARIICVELDIQPNF